MARTAWNSFLETRTVLAHPSHALLCEKSRNVCGSARRLLRRRRRVKDYLAEIKAEKARPRGKERSMSSMPGSCRNSAPIQIEQLATDRIDRWRDKLATQPSACAVSAPRWSRPPARQPTICRFYGLARDERVVFNYR